MIAITPAGWYDWNSKKILTDTPDMVHLAPVLDKAREAGIGLVGMKVGRMLAGRRWGGGADGTVFDQFYDDAYLKADLTDFQRSYAYVLAHGLDVVNAEHPGLHGAEGELRRSGDFGEVLRLSDLRHPNAGDADAAFARHGV